LRSISASSRARGGLSLTSQEADATASCQGCSSSARATRDALQVDRLRLVDSDRNLLTERKHVVCAVGLPLRQERAAVRAWYHAQTALEVSLTLSAIHAVDTLAASNPSSPPTRRTQPRKSDSRVLHMPRAPRDREEDLHGAVSAIGAADARDASIIEAIPKPSNTQCWRDRR
jgi:G:T/U-mismatch repair DNA glycosylase